MIIILPMSKYLKMYQNPFFTIVYLQNSGYLCIFSLDLAIKSGKNLFYMTWFFFWKILYTKAYLLHSYLVGSFELENLSVGLMYHLLYLNFRYLSP
jgi:hypothetical protein